MPDLPVPGVTTNWGDDLNAAIESLHLTGTHAARPTTGLVAGTLYSCTDHGLIYRWDGSAWATWGAHTHTLSQLSNLSILRAEISASPTIPSGTFTTIVLDTLQGTPVGTGLSLTSGHIQVNESGWYGVVASIEFQSGDKTGRRTMRVEQVTTTSDAVNTGDRVFDSEFEPVNTAVSVFNATTGSMIFYATAGRFLRLYTYQNSGVSKTVIRPTLAAWRIG